MPGAVIGINMTFGYPGQASRHGDEVSRTRAVKASTNDIPFGAPVVQNSDGTVQLFGASNVAADFAGIAMRKVKSAMVYPNQSVGKYVAGEPCDVLQRGGVSAVCAWGTAAVGAPVYVRTAVAEGTSPAGAAIGDLGAAPEGTAVAGANTYTVSTNVVSTDKVAFGGEEFIAGTDFEAGASAAASAADLAAAMSANAKLAAIFTFNAVNAAITVTERIPGGGNTPGTMTVTGTGVITAGTATPSAAGNAVKLNDVVWSSAADARKVAELTMKTRQGV